MSKNAAVLTVVCFLLCLSFNYTFPLHRERTTSSVLDIHNHKSAYEQEPIKKQEHGIVDRTKKMAANIEHALKKIIDSTPEKSQTNKENKCSHARHAAIDGDLSNFEQLVIMKKYPYLDLHELDFNLHPPPNKIVKQSLNSDPNLGQDQSFCDAGEEGPNVEITNRGLTGFAIPTKISNNGNVGEIKINIRHMKNATDDNLKVAASSKLNSEDYRLMESLEEDIREFEKHLG